MMGNVQWFESEEGKKRVIDELNKSGVPLELFTYKKLVGFANNNKKYKQPFRGHIIEISKKDNKDIIIPLSTDWILINNINNVSKDYEIDLEGIKIKFILTVLFECKSEEETDYIFFPDIEDKLIESDFFPIIKFDPFYVELNKKRAELMKIKALNCSNNYCKYVKNKNEYKIENNKNKPFGLDIAFEELIRFINARFFYLQRPDAPYMKSSLSPYELKRQISLLEEVNAPADDKIKMVKSILKESGTDIKMRINYIFPVIVLSGKIFVSELKNYEIVNLQPLKNIFYIFESPKPETIRDIIKPRKGFEDLSHYGIPFLISTKEGITETMEFIDLVVKEHIENIKNLSKKEFYIWDAIASEVDFLCSGDREGKSEEDISDMP